MWWGGVGEVTERGRHPDPERATNIAHDTIYLVTSPPHISLLFLS